MSVETASALIEILELIAEKFGMTVDWTGENVLPYLQSLGEKIVAYERNIALLWIFVGGIVAVLAVILFIVGCVQNWDGVQTIILIIGMIAAAIIIIANMYTVIGCDTFPEKIILDYISSFTNTTTRY